MSAQSYELAVARGPAPGTVYVLADQSLTIGRDPFADVLINDPEVSRQHALLISVPSGEFLLQDLGSTNGTFIDGERLGKEPVALRPSNAISMGGTVTLLFRERHHAEDSDAGQVIEPGIPEKVTAVPQPADNSPKLLIAIDKPTDEPLRQPTPITAAENLPHSTRHEAERAVDMTPNLILGLVLLLLCCCLSLMVFLMYLGGDWFFRQIGLVP